jgi:hypothetical protein
MLTQEQLEEYNRYGVLVIENILTDDEVETARNGLHDQLLGLGIDHYKVLMGEQKLEEGVRLKSSASKIMYSKWKMDICLHEKVYGTMRELILATYGGAKGFEQPFGPFDDIRALIDRVCWRLPDIIRNEGGLQLHLDRNPSDPYGSLKCFRPIQAFVTLTDHFGSDYGGLKVVKGFHNEIDEYFKNEKFIEAGPFFRMHSKSYSALEKRLESVIAPKGSLVCWDNRIPHATSNILAGSDTREVVYVGWLPNIPLNEKYCQEQLISIRKDTFDKNWIESDFTEKQLQMLGL